MATPAPSVGRLAHLILDLDYGDEQERLRYYEAYAVVVHLQLVALPAVGAAVILATGGTALGPVLVMLGAVLATIFLGKAHLRRHNVRLELLAMSRQNRGYLTAYLLSCLTLVVAFVVRGPESGLDRGFGLGAVLGLALGIAAVALRARQQREPDGAHAEPES